MLPLLLSLASLPAAAQDIVSELGPPTQLSTSGAWVRALPDGEGGWLLGIATQRGYGMLPLTSTGGGASDWSVEESQRWWLVEQDSPQLDDHNLVQCPDGSWLHVATGTTSRQDDSAWWFRHSADWTTLSSGEVEVGSPNMHHSDPPVMCSAYGEGVLVGPEEGMSGDVVFMEIPQSGAASVVASLTGRPTPVGGAIFSDEAEGVIHRLATDGPSGPIIHQTYDTDWAEVATASSEPLPDPYMAYWPQGRLRIGDYYVLATLGNPERGGGGNRTRPFLVVYDLDWNLVQTVDLVPDGSADGAARPWVSRADDLLLVTWDAGLTPYVLGLRVDLEITGDDPVVDDPDGEDGAGGSGAADEEGGEKDGGCSHVGGLGAGLGWLAGLGLVARRRDG
jgi:hypothetical protein